MSVKDKSDVIETVKRIFDAERLTDKQYASLLRSKRFKTKSTKRFKDLAYPQYTFSSAQMKFLKHLADRRKRIDGKDHWPHIQVEAAYAWHTGQKVDREGVETLFADGARIVTEFPDLITMTTDLGKLGIRLDPGTFIVKAVVRDNTVALHGWRTEVGTLRPMWKKGPKPLDN